MTNGKFQVAESNIHGKGLFATMAIAAGEVLGYIKVRPTDANGPHVLWCDDGEAPYEVLCEFRFINHTNDPNVAYYDDFSVVAIRDIQPGEELTHNYGDDWD